MSEGVGKSLSDDKKYGKEDVLHKIGLVWFVMALACVPIWWQTTSVERFPIPHTLIQDLNSKIKQIPDPNPKYVLNWNHIRNRLLILLNLSMMTSSENYDILISLILPDLYTDWNIEESSKHLIDWSTKMSNIAEFTVSSQIIYHPATVSYILNIIFINF